MMLKSFAVALALVLLFALSACETPTPGRVADYREDGRFVLPEAGFRGVAFADPAETRHDPEATALTAADAFLLYQFTETQMGSTALDVVLDAPHYFRGGGVEVMVQPGFFVGVFRRDLLSGSFPSRFDKVPRDERQRFLLFSVLGYSRKLIEERGWSYAAKTTDRGVTYLTVGGRGAAEIPSDEPFELRWILGRSAEFFLVVARGGTMGPEALTAMLDDWMSSLDFYPDDPARS